MPILCLRQIEQYDDHKADLGYSVIPILNTLDYDQNGNPLGKFTHGGARTRALHPLSLTSKVR